MIPLASLLAFILLSLTLISLWIRRDPKIWGSLLGLSIIAGLFGENILWVGLLIIIGWSLLWIVYAKQKNTRLRIALFIAIVLISFGFKFHLLSGYIPVVITPKFLIGLEVPLMELFPLALLVPLAKNLKDWKTIFLKGLPLACLGVAVLALLAIASGATHWQYKLPTFASTRYLSNFFFVAIPEEGFYRGFVQRELYTLFPNSKGGKFLALFVSSLIFTLAHIYWSPSLDILGFVFLASLLYGSVYLVSGKIESSILCHFLLNAIHMTFFSYHAM